MTGARASAVTQGVATAAMNVVLSVLGGAAAVEIKRHFDKDKDKQRRAQALQRKEQELREREQRLQAAQVVT